ncbi:phage/plasmid replication protein, II/X family [Paraglaciecola marina]|uniref:phage/plasmid replication protein, II/X family n=1 Tax=Paraglaciecola marina TaxID=2500157 RepID=UPI00105F73A4|nr:phage/plasmid replication protein, II/X family [Paraglaciecola marina]
MLDWFRGVLPLFHVPINSGEVFSLDQDGEVEWRSPKRVQVTGSYDKKISIKSYGADGQGNATHLWVSGNPSKFLQGHNVFGSDDLISLVYDMYKVICQQFKLTPTLNELSQVKSGEYDVGMVDINYSFELPSRADVLAFIRALEFKAKTRHGRPSMKGQTLYFGKSSERWAIKLYCKAEEIKTKTGQLPTALINKGIEAWADNKLRVELRLLGKELTKLELDRGSRFNPSAMTNIFNEYMGRIQMTDQIKLTDEVTSKLPNRLLSTYTLWSEGHDLRSMMSKPTYYRQRKELIGYGINIDIRPCEKASTNVIPMFRILEAKPAQIPEWAFSKNLIHPSARYCG